MKRINLKLNGVIYINHQTTLKLIQEFINDSYAGRRLTIKGSRLKEGSVSNYLILQRLLMQYCKAKKFELRIYVESNLSITQKNNANLLKLASIDLDYNHTTFYQKNTKQGIVFYNSNMTKS